jgi:hypothetical protein
MARKAGAEIWEQTAVSRLTAGKGYSVPRRLRALPRRPIHLLDIKVAVTPFARGLRGSGHDGAQRQ